jgi:Protein of unknown function (DUF998)
MRHCPTLLSVSYTRVDRRRRALQALASAQHSEMLASGERRCPPSVDRLPKHTSHPQCGHSQMSYKTQPCAMIARPPPTMPPRGHRLCGAYPRAGGPQGTRAERPEWVALRATGVVRRAARFAPAGLALVLLVLSLSERDYLRAIGWSPVRRTGTEWPSVLALGPHGWVLSIAFVAAGASAVPVGWWLLTTAQRRLLHVGSILFIVMGAGVMAVAFSADPPTASGESWHAHVHNLAYPMLIVAALSSAALFSFARSDETDWHGLRKASRLVLPVFLAGVLISSFDAVAELGRYVLIGGLLVWTHTTARVAARLAAT